ncbi:MAG TPA: calcium-binding protein [Coleofasciculaceae cyanobacterium]
MTRTGSNNGETLFAEGYFWNGWFWLFDYHNTVQALGGDDIIHGGRWNDTIYAGDGNDWVDGSLDHDWISGGNGNDKLYGSIGNDTVHGDAGDDHLDGSFGNDSLYGGDGNDNLHGIWDNDMLDGGNGNDYLNGGNGNDTLYGRSGNDTLRGTGDDDIVYGGAGDDTIGGHEVPSPGIATNSEMGNDSLYGEDGNDTIDGDDGNDFIDGGSGNDQIIGGDNADTLNGGSGNDNINGEAGSDIIDGQDGNDILRAGQSKARSGNYEVSGTHTIKGGNGDDYVIGNKYTQDTLYGDAGNDILFAGSDYAGGTNRDILIGGSNSDAFLLAGNTDVANQATASQIMTSVNEGTKIMAKVIDVVGKFTGANGTALASVGLAFQAISTAISIAQAFQPPKGGWNDLAWIEDFQAGEDSLILGSDQNYSMSVRTHTDLGIKDGLRDVPGVAIYKTGSSEDVVAFLETDTVVQANGLMDKLITTQFSGNGFTVYGQNLNPLTPQLQAIPELSKLI